MKTKRIGLIMLLMALVVLIVAIVTDGGDEANNAEKQDKHMRTALPDTLRVVTLTGPTSYFTYRDQEMGFDYEMAKTFARDNGMAFSLRVAPDIPSAINMLANGEADLIAYDVPKIKQYVGKVDFCGNKTVTHQVVVQQKSDSTITDVTDLIGRTLYVEKDSKYQYRLQNLNDELGGGIGIEGVVTDTIDTPDLVRFVSEGELPLTVIDSDLASICSEHYKNIDTSLTVSMDQVSSWAVAKNDKVLAQAVNKWAANNTGNSELENMHKRYFEHFVMPTTLNVGEQLPVRVNPMLRGDGSISDYDALFRKHAASIGWDWRQLAAIGYNESQFNPGITSWAGAKGIMQLMPASAKAFGVADRITDPDANIMGGARILDSLDKSLRSKVTDSGERRKFVIAAYNSGLGHILDGMALAKKHGKNPTVWYGNVREMLMLKTRPEYYNDPVVKHGYFRAKETVSFVDKVLSTYEVYRSKVAR